MADFHSTPNPILAHFVTNYRSLIGRFLEYDIIAPKTADEERNWHKLKKESRDLVIYIYAHKKAIFFILYFNPVLYFLLLFL